MTSTTRKTNSRRYISLKNENVGTVSAEIQSTDWSDQNFTEFQNKYKDWLNGRAGLDIGKSNAIYYISTYLGFITPSKSDSLKNIKSLLIYMKIRDAYIFSTSSATPSVVTTSQNYESFKTKSYRYPLVSRNIILTSGGIFGKLELESFWKYVLGLYNSAVPDEGQLLINLACFLCLCMYRCSKKETTSIYLHMPVAGSKSFESLFQPPNSVIIPPPAESYVTEYLTMFYAHSDNAIALATVLVKSWIGTANPYVIGVLKASCLLALSENGLGGIGWPMKAANKYKVQIGQILSMCCLDTPLSSQINIIASFIERADKGRTWPFCRLFVDTALSFLSTKSNPNLSVICALIALQSVDLVMGMAQFAEANYMVKGYVASAAAIIQKLCPGSDLEGYTEESFEVVKAASEMRSYGITAIDHVLGKQVPVPDRRSRGRSPPPTQKQRSRSPSEGSGSEEEQFMDTASETAVDKLSNF